MKAVEIQATLSSKVYAAIIANPGITSREIRRVIGLERGTGISIARQIGSLVQRHAVIAVPGETERSTKYYKGSAPVVLRQKAGHRQTDILNMKASMEDIELLLANDEVEKAIKILRNAKKQITRLV